MVRKLFFVCSVVVFALAAFILTLFNYNPYQASSVQFMQFYLAFYFSLSGIFTLFIVFIRYRLNNKLDPNKYFWPSVRQGMFLGLAIVLITVLKGMKLLDWWVGIPTLIAIILLELFFQTKRR